MSSLIFVPLVLISVIGVSCAGASVPVAEDEEEGGTTATISSSTVSNSTISSTTPEITDNGEDAFNLLFEASDTYINLAESIATNPIAEVQGYDGQEITYAYVPEGTPCATASFLSSEAPKPSDFGVDGAYNICARVVINGTETILTSPRIVRDTTPPSLDGVQGINEAADNYINDAEKNNSAALVSLTNANSFETAFYSIVPSGTVCSSVGTYVATSSPTADDFNSDGAYIVCVKLVDLAGNPPAFEATAVINRDTVLPTIDTFALANDASDGSITAPESGSVAALVSYSSTGASSSSYAIVGSATTCNASVVYSVPSIPQVNAVSSDGNWKVCARASDAAGNFVFGSTGAFSRSTGLPTAATLSLANVTVGGYINLAEDNSVLPIVSASGGSYTVDDFAIIGGAATCDGTATFSLGSIPDATAVTVAGSWKVCGRFDNVSASPVYAASPTFTRDVTAPNIASVSLANDTVGGYINDAEKSNTNDLVSVSITGDDGNQFKVVGTGATCSSEIYSLSTIPETDDVTSDGSYKVCVRAFDNAGNQAFQQSSTFTRDIVGPVISSFNLANGASNQIINDSEKSQANPIATVSITGSTANHFVVAATAPACSGQSYSLTAIPNISTVSSDGSYKLCARASDLAGNTTYAATSNFTRDTAFPNISSLTLANEAANGYINDTEKNQTNPLATVSITGQTSEHYIVVGTGATCSAQTYSLTSMPATNSVSSDGAYKVCVRAIDVSGNTSYAQTGNFTRDILAPSITSVSLANEAVGGYINDSEKNSGSAVASLSLSGQVDSHYIVVASGATCSAQTYVLTSIPAISSIGSDGTYKLCIRARDAAGNEAFNETTNVIRDTGSPSISAMTLANDAADGYINAHERTLTNALVAPASASGHTSLGYVLVASATTCNTSLTYSGTIPASNSGDFGSDGAYKVCAEARDAAGNEDHFTGAIITKDIVAPATPTGFAITPGMNENAMTWTGATGTFLLVQRSGSAVSFTPVGGQVYADGFSSAGNEVVYSNTGTSHTETGLTNGTTYHYALFIRDDARNYSTAAVSTGEPQMVMPNTIPTISFDSHSGFRTFTGSGPYTITIFEGDSAEIVMNIDDADGTDSPYADCSGLAAWTTIGGHPDESITVAPDLGSAGGTANVTCSANDGETTSATSLTFNISIVKPELEATSTKLGDLTSTVSRYDEASSQAAASASGEILVVWPKALHAGYQYCVYDGTSWSDCGDLTGSGRYAYESSGAQQSRFKLAAGDSGSFIVCYLDAASGSGSTTSTDVRLKARRYKNGSWEAEQTIMDYNKNRDTFTGFYAMGCDMAPNGDAAVSSVNPTFIDGSSTGGENVSAMRLNIWQKSYGASAGSAFTQIATDSTLTSGSEDWVNVKISNAMRMDRDGNIMMMWSAGTSGSDYNNLIADQIFYAIWDSGTTTWTTSRTLVQTMSGLSTGNDSINVRIWLAVDRTTDITDTSTALRGKAAYGYQRNDTADIYGGYFFSGNFSHHQLLSDNVSATEDDVILGFDIADGIGHAVLIFQDESSDTTASVNDDDLMLVNFWFEDTNSDGVLNGSDSANLGWKNTGLNAVLVNDDDTGGSGPTNAPANWADANSQNSGTNSNFQFQMGKNFGLVIWGDGSGGLEDTVHVRRILGFDSATQSVVLEGDRSTLGGNSIVGSQHHTVSGTSTDRFARYPSLSVDSSNRGVVVYSDSGNELRARRFK